MSDLIERLQKMSVCVYLATEESVADDLADGLKQAAARIKELEAEQERAFGMLAAHGVPKERAKTVANGIDVLTTRFRKAEAAMESGLDAAVAGKEAAERDAVQLVKRLDGEVHNLCQKISRKEDEGWEGSKRRCVLHADAEKFIAAARKEQP